MRKHLISLALWLVKKYRIVTPGHHKLILENGVLKCDLDSAVRGAAYLGNEVVRLSKHVAELDQEIADIEEHRPHLPATVLRILPSTREEVSRIDTYSRPGTSGEYKRHIAMDRLMQQFPDVSKADIGLAIEWVVRK